MPLSSIHCLTIPTINHPATLKVSASFDGTAKIWAMPACTQLKELKGHEGKLVAVDVSHDTKFIVSASHDRTFKLWSAE
jgi:U4/U6 small nuclear ribonucleoprotein PRP4